MEKRQLIAIVVITLMIIGFNIYQSNEYSDQVEQNELVEADSLTSSEMPEMVADEVQLDNSAVETDSTVQVFNEQLVQIQKDSMLITLSTKGAIPKTIELLNYTTFNKEKLFLIKEDAMRNGITFRDRLGNDVSSADLEFTVVKSGKDYATFQSKLEDGSKIEVVYAFKKQYLDWNISIIDAQKSLPPTTTEVGFEMKTDLYLAERDVEKERQITGVFFKNQEDVDYEGESKDLVASPVEGIQEWVTHYQQFFHVGVVFPENNQLQDFRLTSTVPEDSTNSTQFVKTLSTNGKLNVEQATGRIDFNFKLHLGGNDFYALKALGNDMQRIVPLGNTGLQYVNGYLILPLFKLLEGVFSNYGLIIFLLCIIVKLALTPFTFKSYQSQAKMKVVQPLVAAMKEKHSGDTARIQQETMKIYRKTGVSPLGGCLPMVLQFPILIAMYRLFPAAIEFRGKSFLWAEDLSTYDAVIDLPEIPIISSLYGTHVSVFTILAAISVFFYTRYNMSQTATDDSNPMAANMKVIQNFFPIMMLIFFNKAAAGLSFYYFVYNLTTFGQQFLIKKFFISEEKLKAKISGNIKKNKDKPGGRMERFAKKMEQMQNAAKERQAEIDKKKNQNK